jgi:hypothetical protein
MRNSPEIPDHVAAYAAGIRIGARDWNTVAGAVAVAGLGVYRFDLLARAAERWMRAHLTTGGRRRVKELALELERRGAHTKVRVARPPSEKR